MKISVTDHAVDRFIQRSKLSISSIEARKMLEKALETATISKSKSPNGDLFIPIGINGCVVVAHRRNNDEPLHAVTVLSANQARIDDAEYDIHDDIIEAYKRISNPPEPIQTNDQPPKKKDCSRKHPAPGCDCKECEKAIENGVGFEITSEMYKTLLKQVDNANERCSKFKEALRLCMQFISDESKHGNATATETIMSIRRINPSFTSDGFLKSNKIKLK